MRAVACSAHELQIPPQTARAVYPHLVGLSHSSQVRFPHPLHFLRDDYLDPCPSRTISLRLPHTWTEMFFEQTQTASPPSPVRACYACYVIPAALNAVLGQCRSRTTCPTSVPASVFFIFVCITQAATVGTRAVSIPHTIQTQKRNTTSFASRSSWVFMKFSRCTHDHVLRHFSTTLRVQA